ncbi:MAG: ATP-dependent 6-phosphofructokinase [Candidatus Acidiferrales bacterium]|jgi:6-phosphofructokinase 1
MPSTRTIGLTTGGGDCPGLNAAIRAIVHAAKMEHEWRVIGVTDGFNGLIRPEQCHELTLESVRGILPRGGTILGTTNSSDPFAFPVEESGRKTAQDYSRRCFGGMQKLGIEALIVIGGNGTLSIAERFVQLGMKLVGVPKTIDNDLQHTEVTLGFDSALHIATEAIDRLHSTAESHHRVMVVEMMGRDAGWIALHSGVAGGADVILLPEIPFTIECVCEAIRHREATGHSFSVVVVAEGVKLPERDSTGKPLPKTIAGQAGNSLAQAIRERVDKEVRVTVLGHLQRGGSPSPFDRILATRFGTSAVELIAREEYGRMVSLRAGKIESVPIAEAISPIRLVDPASEVVRAARAVGISFGDQS